MSFGPKGLHTEEGRRQVAALIVWGAGGQHRYSKQQIVWRIEALLAKLSRSAAGGKSPAAAEAKSGAAAGFSEDFSSPLPVKKEAQQ